MLTLTEGTVAHTDSHKGTYSTCSLHPPPLHPHPQFKAGKRHGEGVMKFRTGQLVSRYEGMWEFDVPEGVGKFEYTQGNKVRLRGPLLLIFLSFPNSSNSS